MNKSIHYYLILDVETTNGLEQPLVYDIGGVVADKRGNVYEKFSFVIRDIFVLERELMRTAYYTEKIPEYVYGLRNGERKMVDFYQARRHILNLMEQYNIHDVAAYNAHFDRNALNTTQRWLTKSKSRYFFPFNTNFICIWNMACQTICQRKTYKEFCEANQYISKRGTNYSTSAETVYKYLTINPDFIEEHKGFDDVLIETYIMRRCFESHKKMPNGKGIRRNCWMDVKRA